MPMKKRELIHAVAIHTDVDNKTAAKLVEGTIDVILANVAKGEIVNISGFAKFAKIKRPARMARNPATGEPVKVKAKTVAMFIEIIVFPSPLTDEVTRIVLFLVFALLTNIN